ncbi:hypothetical protein [Desulfatiferula olefinivorans]
MITNNPAAAALSEKKGLRHLILPIPGDMSRPFTFDEIRRLAMAVAHEEPDLNGALLFVDHRNLLLSSDDLDRAISKASLNAGTCLIGLCVSPDHACQFKSFHMFVGCEVLEFNAENHGCRSGGLTNETVLADMAFRLHDEKHVMISVCSRENRCLVAVEGKDGPMDPLVVQAIPYDADGPDYRHAVEFQAAGAGYEQSMEVRADQIDGLIVVLKQQSLDGVFDAIENFSPSSAYWTFNPTGNLAVSLTGRPLTGRQLFQPTLVFDGSLCLAGVSCLTDTASHPTCDFMVLENSCIVSDWIDYHYVASHDPDKR